MLRAPAISRALTHPTALTAWAACASFATYFCMYAFRKPFVVASFAAPAVFGLDQKSLFLIAQLLGYCAAKFLGIKVISEMKPGGRALAILGCIGTAELALVFFGFLAGPWAAVALAVNGLALGLVWGLVFSFIEGRATSDLLGAILCSSFILASGTAKAAGRFVLDAGVSPWWMPAATGALFALPLCAATWMLAQLPPPSPAEEALRVKRVPMHGPARRAFVRTWAGALIPLVAGYVVLTMFRDFRDNFAGELWDALGYGASPEILATTEIPVALGALAAVGALMAVRNNRRAVLAVHALLVGGAALVGVATLGWTAGIVSPELWMILVGLGLYIAYVPFNCVLFDRLVAATGSAANAGFLIYVADSAGYVGSVGLLVVRTLGHAELDWLGFFATLAFGTTGLCVALFSLAAWWLARNLPQAPAISA